MDLMKIFEAQKQTELLYLLKLHHYDKSTSPEVVELIEVTHAALREMYENKAALRELSESYATKNSSLEALNDNIQNQYNRMQLQYTEAQENSHSEVSSKNGSKKAQSVRERAYVYLQELLDDDNDISINAMAETLECESNNAPDKFGRKIPLGTCKDYARTVKKTKIAS